MGPRDSLEGCGQSCPPPGLNPWIIQAVASHYTDYTIPAHNNVDKVPNTACRLIFFILTVTHLESEVQL